MTSKESQNVEYKETWRDNCLRAVSAFANSGGGVLIIGLDDHGKPCGLKNVKRLLEDIPNTIRNKLGIIPSIELNEKNKKEIIKITIELCSVPISYNGKYYLRSGSTVQELTGASLNEFLLKKSGKTWDDVAEHRATLDDIDEQSIKNYLIAAEKAGRLSGNDGLSLPGLLEKLRLAEKGQLKRAAIIMFGKDPGKFYPNTFVKIGRFQKNDADIKFQEIEEGNLISLLPAILNLLNRKFLIKPIDFEGMHRIEKGEYPVAALREMLLNALVHRNYTGAPIQIRVYDDRISIWNEGFLPEGLTLDSLKRPHPSRPRNPIIADVCFKGGYIDAWGRGTIKIIDSCKSAELPEPEMTELDGGFLLVIFKDILNEDYLVKIGLNDRQVKAVAYMKEKGTITNKEYQSLFSITDRTALRDLDDLMSKELVLKRGAKKGTRYLLKHVG